MKRLTLSCMTLALFAVACGSDSTAPTSSTPPATKPTLIATLLPSNEVPPVSNGENVGSGSVAVVWDTTTDAAGNITSAKVNFSVSLFNFPTTVALTAAHIHQGPPTCACPVVVSTQLTASDQVNTGTNGATQFAKNGIAVDGALAQAIISNPSAYYFNVHSTANPGGVARGVLSRTQ